ncbi:endonuclease [Actinomadura sp. KC06]|uniref:DNA/RNA non-specific endonuclease n=1 Tax=Actinomadura sp. KC06 TaxID=2530369 RepID=UPI00104A86B3|nr:DNA/RNA non-specific endonuclease [Actinomadura sp. KC06]TDD35538.1 endonuclease [Actinomadura sp. KC06]
MEFYEREQERQRETAARRVAARVPERREHETVLASPGGVAVADSAERVAKRVDRLSRFYGDGSLLEPGAAEPAARLEKIINTVDYVGVRYLDAGVAAARTVGRINIRDEGGRTLGYGTGSLVSLSLLLTNHHVLPDAGTAATSMVEFNYQDGVDGRPLAVAAYALDPERFFLADEGLDFALVAVDAPSAELAAFGHNRLIEAEGKAIIGEFVTIIQHPRGDRKQVALRENRIVDIPELFLHYAADTEPGSSGSPVFNDQWEVVALHHASVPVPEPEETGAFVNEGIRISRICKQVRETSLPEAQRALVDELFAPPLTESAALQSSAVGPPPVAAPVAAPDARPPARAMAAVPLSQSRAGTVTIPLEVTVRLADGHPGEAARETEAIDPDYSTRDGYDPVFLARPLPMPVPSPDLAAVASAELRYHHFSVVMHRQRALALFTACNIDGRSARRPKRDSDRWFFDPRLPAGEQTGEDVYRANDLDRGHLVRRLDPAWGTEAVAQAANDDTFHFTNSTPQHHKFNAGQTLWLGLEDYVLNNADNLDLAVSVFTGPVLAEDDDVYRGVRLPRQFWKIVAMAGASGELSVTGYLLSQAVLIEDLAGKEAFSYGAYKTYQVPVRRIGELTGLNVDPHVQADPLERLEAVPGPREVVSPEDLIL